MSCGRTEARIYLDALRHNFKEVKKRLCANVKICVVLKANAYGHGATVLGELYEKLGADYIAVARFTEAEELRASGITLPILVLGHTPTEYAKKLSELDISQAVGSPDYMMRLAECAKNASSKVKIHLKIDTGMARLGFTERNVNEIADILNRDVLIPLGTFTHLSMADTVEGKDFTVRQTERFLYLCRVLSGLGVSTGIRHVSNSAGIISYPELNFDMVRAGIMLYGIPPSQELSGTVNLYPAMTLTAPITRIVTLPKGTPVSYSGAYVTQSLTDIATVPIGYADGIMRCAGARGASLYVKGMEAKIVGRVCMDQLMLDVSGIGAREGDTVTVFGAARHVNLFADMLDTISYEILSTISTRIPRIYI